MGFFSKLAFWKKKDDLDNLGKDLGLDKELGLDLGAGPSPDLGMGIELAQCPCPRISFISAIWLSATAFFPVSSFSATFLSKRQLYRFKKS